MAIQLAPIEVKTGIPVNRGKGLNKPHTYLEALMQHWGLGQEAITLGTLYEGVRVDDIQALEPKGLHPLVSSEKKAYFSTPEVAQQLKARLFPNQSDAVNYGSVVVSDAKTSTIQPGVRVLVVDDEAPEEEATQQLQDLKDNFEALGLTVDPLTLTAAINSLGDSYTLINPALHSQLSLDVLLQDVPKRLGNQRVAVANTELVDTPDLTALAEPERIKAIQPLLEELLVSIEGMNQGTVEISKVYQQGDLFEVQWVTTTQGSDLQWQGTTVLNPEGESYRWTTFTDPDPINGINQAVRDLRQLGNTPFQFRAGVFEWQGAIKGECRGSSYCAQLGVSAVIPRSSIKGDGKSITPGVYEVDNLWWAYKEGAKVTKQRLGSQVLVNLPNGVTQDVLPQLEARAKALAEATSDPLSLAQLYVAQQEKQQELFPDREPEWAYQLLKADLEGTRVLLEHPAIVSELEKWVAGEWYEIATGGVEVPSAIAQPHQGLLEGEVCFPDLPDGARVCVYRSPLANVASMGVFINCTNGIAESDQEAFQQRGVIYLNPKDAKEKVIDFDGDRVAIIPEQEIWKARPESLADLPKGQVSIPALPHQQSITLYGKDGIVDTFPNHNPGGINPKQPVSRKQVYLAPDLWTALGGTEEAPPALSVGIDQYRNLLAEVIYLNEPERRPPAVEKEAKIPRSPENGFPTLAHAMLDASDNPTGRIADQGMKTQALYWDCQFTPLKDKPALAITIGEHLATLNQKYCIDGKTTEGDRRKEIPTAPTGYDFREGIDSIIKKSAALNTAMAKSGITADRCREAEVILGEMQEILFQANGIVAVNLQRAVDTPKSARKPDNDALDFCKQVIAYKEVEWIKHRKDDGLYCDNTPLPTNTYDPIGWLVAMTNSFYRDCTLERQDQVAYKELFKPKGLTVSDDLQAAASTIARTYLKGQALISNRVRYSHSEEGLRAVIVGAEERGEGRGWEIVHLLKHDKECKSPLWDYIRQEKPLNLQLVASGRGNYPLEVQMQVKDQWQTIGSLSRESLIGAAFDTLKQQNPAMAGKLGAQLKTPLSHQQRKGLEKTLLEQVDLKDVCAQANKGLTNRVLQLAHTPTKEEAKEFRQQLNQQVKELITEQVAIHGEALTMRGVGGHASAWEPSIGQRLVLKLMTGTVVDQFLPQSHTQEVQLIGMQHYEQSWEENVPMTVRVTAVPIEGNGHRTCAQIAQRSNIGTDAETIEWKTIGLIATDSYAPPIGVVGVGKLSAELKQVIIHSPELVAIGFDEGLSVKCSDSSVLTNTPQAMRFAMEGGKPIVKVNGEKLGLVNQTHRNQLKRQYGKELERLHQVGGFTGTIAPDRKTATLNIVHESIQLEPQWFKRHQAETLSPVMKERQMVSQGDYQQAVFLTHQGRELTLLVSPECHISPFLDGGGTLPCRASLKLDESTGQVNLAILIEKQGYPIGYLDENSQRIIQQFEQSQGVSLTNGKTAITGVLAPNLKVAHQTLLKAKEAASKQSAQASR